MADTDSDKLSIIVVGASGDLARKKIFPALFSLYSQGLLPEQVSVFGFARSDLTDDAFRFRLAEHLTCRYESGAPCPERQAVFLARCFYVRGRYESRDSFLDLFDRIRTEEGLSPADRLFYLAIPPSIFLDVARAVGGAGLVSCTTDRPWSRVVIEKPFGRDRASSDTLTREMASVFTESQIYRIDHYLGKEVIQNLMVLRFANVVFEPLWERRHVRRVLIEWSEDIGVGERGGYFDNYGIVRDVVQNHLLQILALTAMERPVDSGARRVRDEKVKVLRCIRPVGLDEIVLGQYTAGSHEGRDYPGYREEPSVPPDSLTPTYACVRLHVDNERWRGVPFVVCAGKGLNTRVSQVRLQFRELPHNILGASMDGLPPNELVIRVQPDEALLMRIVSKAPGLHLELTETELDLRYAAAFSTVIPDAYECLLLDVVKGDKSLFIRSDELAAAWDIFTPVLHQIETEKRQPEPYAFGTAGPESAGALLDALAE